MTGIYKITNNINEHSYIGQSRCISERWKNHKLLAFNSNERSYEYPLYRAIRKYGLDNFTFEVLEECLIQDLNDREGFWIKYYEPEYNQTNTNYFQATKCKLTLKQVEDIQNRLVNDINGNISHKELAEEFNVHRDTIRDINYGYSWKRDDLNYPLHYSHHDLNKPKNVEFFCIDCGIQISKGAKRCVACNKIYQAKINNINLEMKNQLTRDKLKNLIYNYPFSQIGKMFNVSDNTIRKWCLKYNLPSRVKDIKTYNREEWEKL